MSMVSSTIKAKLSLHMIVTLSTTLTPAPTLVQIVTLRIGTL